ncbi:MAG: DUF4158 domain-containing protein [Chroococcidiopsidaceae cyanobacterium CP_BM_RX_35]|nr:DUF4158 domain-containing protein [Chroococcidiopsidaceae cyanobacterium CP_BM_RX_35]
MSVIERTAYPRFKSRPSAKELAELYTPTTEEMGFAQANARGKSGVLRLLVMLKSFQRLGYFPQPQLVPLFVVQHLRSILKLPDSRAVIPPPASRYRYEQAIRDYLKVKPYDRNAHKLAALAITAAAEVKDHPADLINIAIEELVKQRYELPAFSTLDRLAGNPLNCQYPPISSCLGKLIGRRANLP